MHVVRCQVMHVGQAVVGELCEQVRSIDEQRARRGDILPVEPAHKLLVPLVDECLARLVRRRVADELAGHQLCSLAVFHHSNIRDDFRYPPVIEVGIVLLNQLVADLRKCADELTAPVLLGDPVELVRDSLR